MKEFLEAIQPIAEIAAWLAIAIITALWNTYKARLKDIALEAVTKTEAAFVGIHNKSEDKRAHAVGLVVKRFPFVSEKALNSLIDFALKQAKAYAEVQVDKGLDAAEAFLEPVVGGEDKE